MKCARTNCPNQAAANGRQRRLCEKHYTALTDRGYISGDETRQRLELLLAQGMTAREITKATGLSVWWLRTSTGRVQKRTHDRVMGIPLPHAPTNIGVARRIQALAAIGWPLCSLGPMLNRDPSFAHAVMRRAERDSITPATAALVDQLYRRLSGTPGPSQHARRYTIRKGWAPPLAWNNIDTDTAPDLGEHTVVAFPERYQEMRELGYRPNDIAQKMGVQPTSLERQLFRYGLYEGRTA